MACDQQRGPPRGPGRVGVRHVLGQQRARVPRPPAGARGRARPVRSRGAAGRGRLGAQTAPRESVGRPVHASHHAMVSPPQQCGGDVVGVALQPAATPSRPRFRPSVGTSRSNERDAGDHGRRRRSEAAPCGIALCAQTADPAADRRRSSPPPRASPGRPGAARRAARDRRPRPSTETSRPSAAPRPRRRHRSRAPGPARRSPVRGWRWSREPLRCNAFRRPTGRSPPPASHSQSSRPSATAAVIASTGTRTGCTARRPSP